MKEDIQKNIDPSDVAGKELHEFVTLNVGPTHPATHGVFQNVMTMDGEYIVDTTQTIGYIHRAFEKIAERRAYYQILPLTDRMNYCSSALNNTGWLMAVEKLLGLEIPKRVQYMRVIIMELARIADHNVCNSVIGVDTGALTGFTYMFQDREKIYEIWEQICGSRLTTSIGRIGGLKEIGMKKHGGLLRTFMKEYPPRLKEFETLLNRNRIFLDRTVDVGPSRLRRHLIMGSLDPTFVLQALTMMSALQLLIARMKILISLFLSALPEIPTIATWFVRKRCGKA